MNLRSLLPVLILLTVLVAVALYFLLDDDLPGTGAEVDESIAESVAESVEPALEAARPEPGEGDPGDADPSEPTDRQEVVQRSVSGRVLLAEDGSALTDGEVVLLEMPPPFALVPLRSKKWRGGNSIDVTPRAVVPVGSDGGFQLRDPELLGFLALRHPHFATRDVVEAPIEENVDDLTIWVRRAGVVRGRVVTEGGQPLSDVLVRVSPSDNPMSLLRKGQVLRRGSTRTDEQGRFEFPGVPVGDRLLLKALPKDAPQANHRLDVVASGTVDVELVVPSGHAVTGIVVDEQGQPVAGAKLFLGRSEIDLAAIQTGSFDDRTFEEETGEEGRFIFKGLISGTYDIRVKAEGFAIQRERRIRLALADLELPGPIVLSRGETISGSVVDDQGEPVAGATVGFLKNSAFMGLGIGSLIPPKDVTDLGGSVGETDEQGRFVSPPLSSGEYDVSATRHDLAIGSISDVKSGTSGHVIEVARAGSIQGIVMSLLDGEPVRRYQVAATRPFNMFDLKSFVPPKTEQIESEDGTFVLSGLEEGSYTLEVSARGHGSESSAELQVEVGKVTRGVIIMLPEEAHLHGLVLDVETGEPVPGARVTTKSGIQLLRMDTLAASASAVCDVEGRFALSGLKEGKYKLTATADNHAPATSERVWVGQGQTVEGITIRLDQGAVIHGTVTRADDTPHAGAIVQAVAMGTMIPIMTTTDTQGRYEMTGLGPGSYSVTKLGGRMDVGSEDMLSSLMNDLDTKNIKVDAGQTVVCDFKAGEGGWVTVVGRVTEGNEGRSGAILSFAPIDLGELGDDISGPTFRLATSGGDGRYEMAGMLPGEWTVTIQVGLPFAIGSKQSFDVTIPDLPEYRKDFELVAAGIEGRITAVDLNQPLPGIRVAVTALDESATVDAVTRAAGSRRVADVFTADDGRYAARGLPPGRYRVVAGGPGMFGLGSSTYGRSEPLEVEVFEEEMTDGIDFRLAPGGSLAGEVRDLNGRAVQGAALFLSRDGREEDRHFGEIITDEAGSYRAEGLTPGVYTVVVKASRFAPLIQAGVTVRASEVTERNFTLKTGGRLVLLVRGAEGLDLSRASVRLYEPGGIELTRFVTINEAMVGALGSTGSGRYDLGALGPGRYSAHLILDGQATEHAIEHGGADQEVAIDL